MRFGLFITLALLLPVVASAQALGETSDFSMAVSPQYPAPYSRATLSFLSSSFDLANATLSVSVNGKNIYQGAVQSVPVTLGKAGSIASVIATVSSSGTNYTQTAVIRPQDVALVIEPISSAPTLYPGKPLVPLEGSTRVVAVANFKDASGKSFGPSSLSYSWMVDDTRIANSSGIGKESIMVASPLQYRSRTVSVSIMNTDGSLVGGASLALTPVEPSVRIYENDPLLGIRFDRALFGTFTIQNTESSLYAAPLSLPTTSRTPLIQWFLNGTAAQTGPLITLRPSGKGEGSASLSLIASASESASATMSLSLIFGTKSSNFFGL